MVNVLFVCTGNICRSPAAEVLAAQWVARYRGDDVASAPQFSSAGTMPPVGRPIEPMMRAELEKKGLVVPENFRTRRLSQAMSKQANLILGMQQEHVDAVLKIAPAALKKTFTLGHLSKLAEAGEFQGLESLATLQRGRVAVPSGVVDPFGQGQDVFSEAARQLEQYLPPVLEALVGSRPHA